MVLILTNISFFILLIYFYTKTKHALHMLQLESYMNNRYFKWMMNNKKRIFNTTEIIITVRINSIIDSKSSYGCINCSRYLFYNINVI